MAFGDEKTKNHQSVRNEKAATNIDRLLVFFTQRANHKKILEWRQEIENQKAAKENRTPKRIAIKTANRDFGRALRSERSPLKKRAWDLARGFLKQPAIVAYYKKGTELPGRDPLKDASLKVQAAQQHFTVQAKNKRRQAKECEPSPQKTLLNQQAECFANLELALAGIIERMNKASKGPPSVENPSLTLKADDPVVVAYMDYAQFMKKADRLGLADAPYIREWHIHQDRRPGSKRILSQPILGKELEIYGAIDSMRQQGYSWRRIHQGLMNQQLISKKSWQAFHKWLTRRRLQELYPCSE